MLLKKIKGQLLLTRTSVKSIKLFVFIMTLTASFTQAQNNTIETLHFLKGNWKVDNYELVENQWKSIGTTHSKINLEHEGRFISEKVKYLSKYGEINMITNIGYDNRLKKLKLCAMDKEYGYMDIYFGEWIDNNLVFTNLESDLPVKLDDGKELSFRLTFSKKSSQTFTHLVEGTYDKGKTWFSFSRSIYIKQ